MTAQSTPPALRVTQPGSQRDWNGALVDLPNPHLLQSWEWSALKSRHGWEAARYLWVDPGTDQPRSAAAMLTRRLTPLPMGVMYVPKEPVLDYTNAAILNRVLEELEAIARRERALLVEIDPDVRPDTADGRGVLETLRRRGWRPSEEEIQFRNTILLDLRPSLDDRGFGGTFVEHIGAWDYAPWPLGYWLYAAAMPRVLAATRWLHWLRTDAG